ncbi:cytochrome P450 3A19-like [Pollicipes pollicipes]|uniref:cytochrome P450 3A19-like n=1 Tax=Pollicipes pollicipes TaxID=41117 RepID=UPI00188556E3|nr:cytochrome P450 3A19-like [Pollicipes pollicipes]
MEMKRPVLFVGDPDLIRAITIKDFECFTDRRGVNNHKHLEEALTSKKGAQWKETRAVMSPTFSASKLKAMHELTLNNAHNLAKYALEEMKRQGEVEIKDAFGRFTMDNIASCALSFLADVVNETIRHREEHSSTVKDFLNLLLETKDKDGNRVLSNHSILSQSVLFLIAGYDTTATALTFAAYSLATSPDAQQRAQQDVDDALAKHGGHMTYEAVMEMTYLDRVLLEALRLYPPATRIERMATKDYTLPGTNVHLPKGMVVQMSVFSIHRDPDHYPDPLRFDPDRFLPEEKEKRHPCVYLPFGSGPRNCIAKRFALFEAKVALAALLREATLLPTEGLPPPPMPLDRKRFILTPQGKKMPLKLVPRDNSR